MIKTLNLLILIGALLMVTKTIGAAGQDRKKAALMGEAWEDWASRTSFLPFANGLKPMGMFALIGGTILFLAATFAHQWYVGAKAGLFLWL